MIRITRCPTWLQPSNLNCSTSYLDIYTILTIHSSVPFALVLFEQASYASLLTKWSTSIKTAFPTFPKMCETGLRQICCEFCPVKKKKYTASGSSFRKPFPCNAEKIWSHNRAPIYVLTIALLYTSDVIQRHTVIFYQIIYDFYSRKIMACSIGCHLYF